MTTEMMTRDGVAGQGQQRDARRHWWRRLLEQPRISSWEETFDEMVRLRFEFGSPERMSREESNGRTRTLPC